MKPSCLICGCSFESEECVGFSGPERYWICPSCLADAKLGRMVRGLAPGGKLKRLIPGGWHCMIRSGQQDAGLTPEEALERAGVREVER